MVKPKPGKAQLKLTRHQTSFLYCVYIHTVSFSGMKMKCIKFLLNDYEYRQKQT